MNLTGKCLIARPDINDALFKRSVIYIYEHTEQGTAGLILNKRRKDLSAVDVFLNRGFAPVDQSIPVYHGGPVNEKAVVLLHTNEWQSSNTMAVDNQLSVTSDDLMFYKFNNGNVPNGYKFCTGVAVWHPQQIVAEINCNHWLTNQLSLSTILDYEGRELWDRAVTLAAKHTIDRYI